MVIDRYEVLLLLEVLGLLEQALHEFDHLVVLELTDVHLLEQVVKVRGDDRDLLLVLYFDVRRFAEVGGVALVLHTGKPSYGAVLDEDVEVVSSPRYLEQYRATILAGHTVAIQQSVRELHYFFFCYNFKHTYRRQDGTPTSGAMTWWHSRGGLTNR